jgi:branched-chain amino acid transport system substrate-binding protein
MRPVVKPLLAVALALAGVASCSDDDPDAAESVPDTTANSGDTEPPDTTDAPHESDGVLRIGVLLPQTGEGAAVGSPAAAGANYAVNLINRSGGVLGEPVGIETVDEGQTMDQAQAAVAELLTTDVDAVVGPASSLVALEHLDDLVSNGVLTCSPSATSMALDEFPDGGLFFRTAPSDSIAAIALAAHAQRTGVNTATVVYVDDAFGRPFARAVMDELRRRQMEVLPDVPLQAGAVDYASAIEQIVAAEATGTIIVVAGSDDGWNFLSQLAEQMLSPPKIVVNDALRRPPAAEMVVDLPPDFRDAIVGYSPMALLGPGIQPEGAFASQAYDCVNLIALAAQSVGSDDPTAIARAIRGVADEGVPCSTFEECVANIDLDLNYQGAENLLGPINADGDPSRATFQEFQFDANGLDFGSGSGDVTG